MIKSYTDLQQSKKLTEFLPLESADMYYPWDIDSKSFLNIPIIKDDSYYVQGSIPCWSLAVLLNIIPKRIKEYYVLRIDISENDTDIWYDEIGYGVNNNLPDIIMEYTVGLCLIKKEIEL